MGLCQPLGQLVLRFELNPLCSPARAHSGLLTLGPECGHLAETWKRHEMLLWLKSAPTPYSEVRRVLPPSPEAASPAESGRVPFRPVGCSGKDSGEGLPLLGGPPRGAQPAVPGAGRARATVSLSLCGRLRGGISRAHSHNQPSRRWGNLAARREAAGATGEISAETVFEVLKCLSSFWPVFPT